MPRIIDPSGSRLSLTRDEVREYDRRAIASGIPGCVLMENAGRGAAELLVRLGIIGPVAIVCGKGNNAGDGFVMARWLKLLGYQVEVHLLNDPVELAGDALTAFTPLPGRGVPIHRIGSDFAGRIATAGLIVDALLGTGLVGSVRAPFDKVIEVVNASRRPVLAVDLPSGLDCDTGLPLGATIVAAHTATFVSRKRGFDNSESVRFTGVVHVLPIGA